MRILQTSSSIFIHQKKCASSFLSKFGLKECKAVTTPLVVSDKLSKDDGSGLTDKTQYRQIVEACYTSQQQDSISCMMQVC